MEFNLTLKGIQILMVAMKQSSITLPGIGNKTNCIKCIVVPTSGDGNASTTAKKEEERKLRKKKNKEDENWAIRKLREQETRKEELRWKLKLKKEENEKTKKEGKLTINKTSNRYISLHQNGNKMLLPSTQNTN